MEVHPWYIVSIKLLLINIIHTNDIIIFAFKFRRMDVVNHLYVRTLHVNCSLEGYSYV